MAGQRFGRIDLRDVIAEYLAYRLQFTHVANRCAGAMCVNVVNRFIDAGHGLLHASHRAFTRRLDHVITVGSRTVTDHFGVDFCTACLCVLQFFKYHHAAATGNDEAITGGVVGA